MSTLDFLDGPIATPQAPGGAGGADRIANFVSEYRDVAEAAGERLGVSPEIILAQLGLETGWGKSVIPGTNNLGNIKAFDGSGVAARDNMTGSTDRYRAYDTPQAFAADYASLLERKYRGTINAGGDVDKFASALTAGGYAEDPKYAAKIKAAYNQVAGAIGGSSGTPGRKSALDWLDMGDDGGSASADTAAHPLALALEQAAKNVVDRRTWGQVAADTGVQVAEGVNTILGAVPNLVAPESGAAKFFNDNAQFWRDKQSAPLQAKIAQADAAITKAGEDGMLSQIAEAASQYFRDPALAARFVTTNLPSMIPGIGAAKLTQAAALARGATAAKAAAAATTAAGAANAVLNAGGARGEAFEDIKSTLIKQGISPERAEELALKDSRVVAAVGGLAGFMSGKTGLEKAIAGHTAKGGVRSGLGSAATELIGEQIEEVAPKVATNVQAGAYDSRPVTQDVGRAIVETAIGSGPGAVVTGGLASRADTLQPVSAKPTDEQNAASFNTALDSVGKAGSVDEAIAAATAAASVPVNIDLGQSADEMTKQQQIRQIVGTDAMRNWMSSIDPQIRQEILGVANTALSPGAASALRSQSIEQLYQRLSEGGVFAAHEESKRSQQVQESMQAGAAPTTANQFLRNKEMVAELIKSPEWDSLLSRVPAAARSNIVSTIDSINNPRLPAGYRNTLAGTVIDFARQAGVYTGPRQLPAPNSTMVADAAGNVGTQSGFDMQAEADRRAQLAAERERQALGLTDRGVQAAIQRNAQQPAAPAQVPLLPAPDDRIFVDSSGKAGARGAVEGAKVMEERQQRADAQRRANDGLTDRGVQAAIARSDKDRAWREQTAKAYYGTKIRSPKLINEVLRVDSPEAAAAVVREMAAAKRGSPKLLDALHQSLIGQSLTDYTTAQAQPTATELRPAESQDEAPNRVAEEKREVSERASKKQEQEQAAITPDVKPEKPAQPEPEQPKLGREVERYTGMYKKGMNEFNARMEAKRRNSAQDKVEWRIESAEEEFGPDKHVIVGYEKSQPAEPAKFFKQGDSAESSSSDAEQSEFQPRALTAEEKSSALADVKELNNALRAAGIPAVTPLSKIPTANHALAKRLGEVFGAKVQFVSNNSAFEGVAHKGVAYLTENLKRPELAIAGHEVFHTLEQKAPEMAEKLLEHVRGYLQENAISDRKIREELLSGKPVSEWYAAGEVLADINGAMWLDPKFWREMRDRDESMFRRVAYLFMETLTKAVKSLTGTRFDVSALVTDVDAVRSLIAQTWADYNQSRDGNAPRSEDIKMSRNESIEERIQRLEREAESMLGPYSSDAELSAALSRLTPEQSDRLNEIDAEIPRLREELRKERRRDKGQPSREALEAEYKSPDDVPKEVMRWVRTHASTLTSDATDAVRWARIVDTLTHERYQAGDLTIYRAVEVGDEIRPGDWVTTDRRYAEDHLRRYLNGRGAILEETVDGRDVLVSPTGNDEEAIYAPRELSGTIEYGNSKRDPESPDIRFSRNIPDATIGGALGDLSKHSDYAAAKAGDIDAAIRIADDAVTPDLIRQIQEQIGDARPIVQPVVAIEASGTNKIPTAAAASIAKALDLPMGTDIVQSSSPKRTGLAGLERIFNRPEFDGDVEKGEAYLLVDDTITQGGTFAALVEHIEARGGMVAGAVALTGKSYSARMALSDQTLEKLREKFGDIEQQFRGATGHGFDALTESEARYLVNFKPADGVRDRILATGKQEGDTDSAGEGPQENDLKFSRLALGELTAEQAAAAERILGKPKTIKERAKELRQNIGKNLVQGIFDQFAPIRDLDEKAYILSRMSKGGDSTLEAMMIYGKPFVDGDGFYDIDYSQEKGKAGFATVLAPLKGEHDRFFLWVATQRAERLKAIGLENLFSDKDIQALKTLADGKMDDGRSRTEAYAKALMGMNEFNDAVLKIAVDSGLIDEETRKMYKDTPYVPFYRLQEEGVTGFGMKAGLVNQAAWKKLKGGTEKLNEDLLANTLQNWSHLVTAAAKNRAAKATLEAAVRAGIAEEVPNGTPGKGLVSFRDGSKDRTFLVSDPHVMDAVSALEYAGLGPWAAPLTKMKRLLTMGVTANPAFKIRNLLRDSIQAIGTADLSYNPLDNLKSGWLASAEDSETRAKMLASGGMIRFGSMLEGASADRARSMIHKFADGDVMLANENAVKRFWRKTVQPALDVYQELGDRGEQINRAALYERLIDKGMSHGEASFWARDLMDFSSSGKWQAVRFLTQVVPFMNARLQGLYKLGRSGMEDYKRFGLVTGTVALASIALMLGYKDDDDWKKREDWDRQNYWWFKVGETAFRIPKPFELGAIGTIAEFGVEMFADDEMTGKRFVANLGDIVGHQLSMNPIPQLVKPMLDVYANTDSFTKRPIESLAMQRLRPEDRYNERTSEVARFVGSLGLPDPVMLMMGHYEALSPVKVDALTKGYFSWFGTMATTALDYGIRPMLDRGERPAMQLKDAFVVGNFAEGLPTNSSRYVSQMYEQAKEIEQAYASYQQAAKQGDFAKAQEILNDQREQISRYHSVEAVKRQESEINARINKIEANPAMPAETKRRLIDMLAKQRDQIARQLAAAR